MLQEVDESGAEVFTVLLPSGIPLPARRHHILSGGGKLTPLRLEIYQRFVKEQPEKLAKVKALALDLVLNSLHLLTLFECTVLL